MVVSPMTELPLVKPVHFVSLPSVPPPSTAKFGPDTVAVGAMLKKGLLTFADLIDADVKLRLNPVSVYRLSAGAAFAGVAANSCTWFVSLRPAAAALAVVVCACALLM